ncbi:hypothetical protein [Halapricum desulfuricans]|nr:hypothetical protein [Halapricum desulfuricans]
MERAQASKLIAAVGSVLMIVSVALPWVVAENGELVLSEVSSASLLNLIAIDTGFLIFIVVAVVIPITTVLDQLAESGSDIFDIAGRSLSLLFLLVLIVLIRFGSTSNLNGNIGFGMYVALIGNVLILVSDFVNVLNG